jgi:hypothetical protein
MFSSKYMCDIQTFIFPMTNQLHFVTPPRLFFFGATALIWALAYLHETFRFTSVF